jgi:copper chaperone
MITYDFHVQGMHCASCGLLIDDYVEDVPGVISSQTFTRENRTTVEANPWCTPEAVIAAITEAGYTAQLVQP